MENKIIKDVIIPSLVVLIGGLFVTAIAWFAYLGIVLSIEALFYKTNPMDVPMDLLRVLSTVGFAIVTFFIIRSKAHEYIKAIFTVGSMTTIAITAVLSFYETVYLSIIIIVIINAIIAYILKRSKKPWYYYLAIIYALVLGLAYGWPI